MSKQSKIGITILLLVLIACALLLALNWEVVSNFCMNSIFKPIGDFFANIWNSIFNPK